ncbi:hypothetical protein FG386_000395 [Cryptosporidium ryanae]|uniref:uncharacterized protein n=1 Tax=Cryptosporidium ryanae TaxID=515981 RepID=UPI00351A2251|nr:hypothetical protein FG386_000395 [Cryptosporidium ryanae]
METIKKVCTFCFFVKVFFYLFAIGRIYSRPHITISGVQPTKEEVYSSLYDITCESFKREIQTSDFFGGYPTLGLEQDNEDLCLKIEENNRIEATMRELGFEISLEDPILSAQFLWTFVRIKYKMFLLEVECFNIWKKVLFKLKLIKYLNDLKYENEYNLAIRSKPRINGSRPHVDLFPLIDDFLLMLTLATIRYKNGKFATDFTGKNKLFKFKLLKERMTPLIHSNIEYYVPKLVKMYPPSFRYKNSLISTALVYRLIYYCTGYIISPKEAWELWGLVMIMGGGGFIDKYNDVFEQVILTQNIEDNFPEERNFFTVIEKLSSFQNPQWNITFPPIYENNESILKKNPLFMFFNLKGYSLPNKNMKDNEGIAVIYHIFHYYLNIFISVNTSKDIWMVLKRWLNISRDINISNKVRFVQYNGYTSYRDIIIENIDNTELPEWASGTDYIDSNSEIMLTYLEEFEYEFPYTVTCPDGDLVLKNNGQGGNGRNGVNRSQQVDHIAIKIAKEIHMLLPFIKFSDICDLGSSLSLKAPIGIKLLSKYIHRLNNNIDENIQDNPELIFSDTIVGIDYCKKGILNLINESREKKNVHTEAGSIISRNFLEMACQRILKSPVKCSLEFPFYFPFEITNFFNTFAGNVANVMSSSFMGETNFYNQVIGTIWDGKIQKVEKEREFPTFYRLYNPKFNPESLCKFVEGFINPAIIDYFQVKTQEHIKKRKISEREKQKISNKTKEKYFRKTKDDAECKLFTRDLYSLKKTIDSHKIPKGALLSEWKNFVIDESTISSFITRMFKKSSDFESVCRRRLELFLREGNLQFHPVIVDYNFYREFLIYRKERSKLFFKKVVRDDKPDPNIKELANFIIFKQDSPEFIPEVFVQTLADNEIFTRSDLQFKNMISWYISDSCQKAYRLISKNEVAHVKRNCFDKFSYCFNFIENSAKSEENGNIDQRSLTEYKENEARAVEEALEFGLATILGNYNIDLRLLKMKHILVDGKPQVPNVTPYTDILDKKFIIANAAFIRIHFISNMLFISNENALAAARIAAKLLKSYYLNGEVLVDKKFVDISSGVTEYHNKNNAELYEEITSTKTSRNFYRELCKDTSIRNNAYGIIDTLIKHRNIIESYHHIVDWKTNYLQPNIACEIARLILEKRKVFKPFGMLDDVTKCMDYIANKMYFIPHIPVPACTSENVLLECEDGDNRYNFFSTTIFSNLLVDDTLYKDLFNETCKLSRIMQLYHVLPNFSNNCFNLLDKTFKVNNFFLREYKFSPEEKRSVFKKICSELDISHSCRNIPHPKLRSDAEKIGDTIVFQIMNEMSEYNIYFGKNVNCEIAEEIARSDIQNCFTRVQELLKTYIYFEFPSDFEKTICLKINLWPRKCESEAFENHSIFSIYIYDNILVPLQSKDYENKLKTNKIYFTDICELLERNNYRNSGHETDSEVKIDPTEFCNDLFEHSGLYVNLVDSLADEMKKCVYIVKTDLLKIANDQLNLEFFDQNNDQLFYSTVFLPSYMIHSLTDSLINNYRLPPRITIMSISILKAINKINSIKENITYTSSTFAVIFSSLKIVFSYETMTMDELIEYCVKITSDLISPTPNHDDHIKICRQAVNIYQNKKLNQDIYLLYSINEKVSSYYTTPFTSRSIELLSKDYVLKILRGKPSQDIQKVYEKVLESYIDYMLTTGFSGSRNEKTSNGNEITICTYKKITVFDTYKGRKTKKKEIENNLEKFFLGDTYDIEMNNNSKSKLFKAIQMFNFLLELKRIGAVQIHSLNIPSKMINELKVNSLLSYLPPDLANWVITFENLGFMKNLFVVPFDYEGDFGPLGKFDQENEKLRSVMQSEGVLLSEIRHSSINMQAIKDIKKTKFSSFILPSTAYFLMVNIDEVINYGLELSMNTYLFRNSIKKLLINEELLEGVYPKYKIGSIKFSKKEFTAVEAIEYFINEKLSTLKLKVDFHWNDLDIPGDFHKDSLYNFDGKLDSNVMKTARRRIFCDLMTKQLLRSAETGDNPFFECRIFQVKNNAYEELRVHTEGKTFKICTFTGKATKARKMGENESNKLTKEYLSFLLKKESKNIDLSSYTTKLSPEIIIRSIGRIYGHCLLFEEPMNLNFHYFMFKHLTDGDVYFEADIKRVFEPRISKFQKIITTSYKDLDIKKYPTPRLSFENSKKRVVGDEPIYYYVDSDEYSEKLQSMSAKKQSKELLKVRNFNNLRFLKRNITKFILNDKFELELNSFIAGVSDIIPTRFLRGFKEPNLAYYVQGHINKNIRSDTLFKKMTSEYFFVEDNELLLPHKSKIFNYFITAINSLSLIDIGYFFSIFVNRFTILLPTAYIGRIKVVEAPMDNEANLTNRIIINPLQLTVYVPFYSSYSEYEKNVIRLVENQKKILNPIIK